MWEPREVVVVGRRERAEGACCESKRGAREMAGVLVNGQRQSGPGEWQAGDATMRWRTSARARGEMA